MKSLPREETRRERRIRRRNRDLVHAALTLLCVAVLVVAVAQPLRAGSNTTPITATTTQSAATAVVTAREEVIYATLAPTGQVQAAFAVTALEVSQPGSLEDYGPFSSALNLTSTAPLTLNDGTVSVEAPAGRFFYQGNLVNLQLPWDIAIRYLVEGQPTLPSELAGSVGPISIEISTTPGAPEGRAYYENYLLQISLTLDTRYFTNITAAGGTVANAGRNKVVTFTVMPDSEGNVSLSADTTDFVLPPIEIAALPLSLQLDTPDTSSLTEELEPLSTGVSELHRGMGKLRDGVKDLRQGASSLAAGADQFGQGLSQLDSNSGELVIGSAQIMQALNAMAAALDGESGELNLGSILQLAPALAQLSAGLSDVSAALDELDQAFTLAYSALEQSIDGIPTDEISQAQLGALYAANPERTALLDSLVQYYTAARVVQGTFQAVQPAFAAMGMSLGPIAASIDTISATLADMSAQLGSAMQSDPGAAMLPQFIQGISALSQQYQGFHQGLSQYTHGLTQLAEAYAPLSTGVGGIAKGSAELEKGASQMHTATRELRDGVSEIPDRIAAEVESLIQRFDKSDFVPASFLSSRNLNTTAVQFVMRTHAIEKEAKPVKPDSQPAPLTFWDRLSNLFRPQ